MTTIRFIVGILSCLSLSSCGGSSSKESDTSYLEVSNYSAPKEEDSVQVLPERDNTMVIVPFTERPGNTITIPVKINGIGLDMIYDSVASSTVITLAEAKYLREKGLLSDEDLLGSNQFRTADGSIHEGLRVIIRKVEIGDKIILNNVEATVLENLAAPLLLGQSVMKNFKEISVDRENKVIKFIK